MENQNDQASSSGRSPNPTAFWGNITVSEFRGPALDLRASMASRADLDRVFLRLCRRALLRRSTRSETPQ